MKRRLVALVLTLAMVATLAACGGGKTGGGSATGDFIAENGKSSYSVLVDPGAGEQTKLAASDFARWFGTVTGIDLPVVTDSRVWSEDAEIISFGDNGFAEGAGLSGSGDDQGSQGFHIETKGKSVFVCGGGDLGNYYGAYDLLGKLFKLEFYAPDETYYEQSVTVPLPKLKYSDAPDFDYRVIYTGQMISNGEYRSNLRTVQWESVFAGAGAHNTFKLIGTTREEHPDWFARELNPDGTVKTEIRQLCFTNPEVVERLKEAVIAQVDANPGVGRESTCVFIEDTRTYCLCPDCKAMMEKYGGCASAAVIHAVNEIADAVQAHLDETDPGRKMTVVMAAYNGYVDAPVKENPDGTYSPIDETVVLRDNAGVMLAPADTEYYHSYYEEDYNPSERRNFAGWNVLSKNLYLWNYVINFSHYLVPYDGFQTMQENFRYFKEHSVKYCYWQGNYSGRNGTGFINLANFLNAKLMWDVDADVDALTDAWFEHNFRDAAPAMRKYFDGLRLHFAYLRENMGVTGGIYFDIENRNFWPYGTLHQWLGYIDEAYAAIEKYKKSDPELYQKIYDRICLESISPRHLTALFYKGMIGDSDFYGYAAGIKDDMRRLGVGNFNEGTGIDGMPY